MHRQAAAALRPARPPLVEHQLPAEPALRDGARLVQHHRLHATAPSPAPRPTSPGSRSPRRAPSPPAMAVGVASPSAQGHEDRPAPRSRAYSATEGHRPARAPATRRTPPPPRAMTTGTNTPLILSAIFSMGALELVASSARRMMPAKRGVGAHAQTGAHREPAPDRVHRGARHRAARHARSTGTALPRDDRLVDQRRRRPAPSPSTGTGFARRAPPGTSPGAHAGRPAPVTSTSPTTPRGRLGRKVHELGEGELVVLPFARASRVLAQRDERRWIMAADSKYRSHRRHDAPHPCRPMTHAPTPMRNSA